MNNNYVIILDDGKKYTIINFLDENGKKYIYLMDIDDFKNILIGELNNETITVIKEPNLFGELFIKFNDLMDKDTE